ncbi:MAG TPA: hypothetical protein PK373_00475 [Sedimentisphaerales bacterium]|nr:hypothetical protein [Sedimentisphaerales bacterium]HQG47533.1 hypothetical protein [Sedimentisphaerales bacterium]
MYELLVRIETLFRSLNTPALLGIGAPMLLIGLVLWLGGSRYSSVIIGLLGAVVGSVAGLLVGQWLGFHLWLSMLIGAAVLATASVLLRNALILVLAVLVIASVSGAGYVGVVLDRIAPQQAEPAPGAETRTGLRMPVQSFTHMDPGARLNYVDQMTKEQTFRERLRAMLDNTWQAVEPHVWKVGLSVLAGGLVAVFLVWLVKKALIALAYSIVGTTTILLGAQAALLGAGMAMISQIGPRPWVLPGTFAGMTAVGWICQLFVLGPKTHAHAAAPKESQESEK